MNSPKARFIALGIALLQVFLVLDASAQRRKKPSTPPTANKSATPTQTKKPITKEGLIEALRIGGLSPKALVQEVRSRGVSFEVSAQTETELRIAGATTVVIDAARTSYRPLVGYLNVTSSAPGTDIVVGGVGSYSNQITDLKLSPGRYKITADKFGHRKATSEVEVKLFETLNVNLTVVPLTPDELMVLATQSYEKGQHSTTLALTKLVLAEQPNNPKATALIGPSLYANGDYDASVPFLTKSVLSGDATSLPVLHRHGGSWDGKTLCAGRLTFRTDSVEFYSNDYPSEGFVVPYAKVVDFNLKDQLRLNVKVMVKLPKNKKETAEEYNYYSTDAVATGRLITCNQCLPRMRVVLQLLRRFKTGS